MNSITDPATELANLCDALGENVDERGVDYLARRFEVKANSREFYRIIAIIMDRVAALESTISSLDIPDSNVAEAKHDLAEIAAAFTVQNFVSNWKGPGGPHFLRRENTRFLRGLSYQVSLVEAYPVLSNEQVEEFLGKAVELESHLKSLEQNEPDFIRMAILAGIIEFQFCMKHLKWVGWAKSKRSIDELFHAYMVLEKRMPDDNSALSAKKTLELLGSLLKQIMEVAERGKGYWELGRFYLEFSGVSHLLECTTKCSVPRSDGIALCSDPSWRKSLWDKFYTTAPRPRTPSELQYSDRKLRSRT